MPDATDNLIVEAAGLVKRYPGAADRAAAVIDGLELMLARGESLAVVGPSGCGKTTLLNILGTLDRPTSGVVRLDGQDVTTLNDKQLAAVRAQRIGFVFQDHHLLPQCSAIENVLIPTLAAGAPRDGRDGAGPRAAELLERVGLGDRASYRPDELSGGQRQRVAIVRALINRPGLLLVDEPTGALDADTAEGIVDLLVGLNRDDGVTLVMVTHAMHLAQRLGRVATLRGGTLHDT